ncbi:MAG: transglutaminaseTgpA domain-containing protein [Mycobacteriaceae bacterium]
MSGWSEDEGSGRSRAGLIGGTALVLGTAALRPLFTDLRWLPVVIATIVVVVLGGIGLRCMRLPLAAVVLGQLVLLGVLVTVLFTSSGIAGILPGPTALGEVRDLLNGAGAQIRDETVPVDATPQLEVLLVLLLGAAAVVVDGLVAGLQAPAGAGLVLLTLVAVPASLVDTLLPWWSFVLGGLALMLLLLADGPQRVPRAGPAAGTAGLRSPAVTVVLALALVVGLLGGSATLGLGTEGRLSGSGGGGGVGLNPFTQLRGQLDQPRTTDLFTVQGLADPTYLRALALDTFVANQGWVLDKTTKNQPASAPLTGVTSTGTSVDVTVVPQRYTDRWLPSPGTPVRVRGTSAPLTGFYYDRSVGTLFTATARPLPGYQVQAVVPGGTAAQLRAAGSPTVGASTAPAARFYDTGGIDPRVAQITAGLVPEGTNALDAAVLLSDYFRTPTNGFTYDLRTNDGSGGDALVDFLTTGRSGFCEQYASAMAAMLRTLGVPTRVGVGFTAGTGDERSREVTTDDAHAWVEVYFTGYGWVQFDPTPLTDGRGVVPAYVTQAQQNPGGAGPTSTVAEPVPTTAAAPRAVPGRQQPDRSGSAAGKSTAVDDTSVLTPARVLGSLGILVGLALVLGGPVAVRSLRRRGRLADGGPGALWDEVLDSVTDHGFTARAHETPRTTADRAIRELGLETEAADALRELLDGVEDSWYGAGPSGGTGLLLGRSPAEAATALRHGLQTTARVGWRQRWWPPSLHSSMGASSLGEHEQ